MRLSPPNRWGVYIRCAPTRVGSCALSIVWGSDAEAAVVAQPPDEALDPIETARVGVESQRWTNRVRGTPAQITMLIVVASCPPTPPVVPFSLRCYSNSSWKLCTQPLPPSPGASARYKRAGNLQKLHLFAGSRLVARCSFHWLP